MCLSVRVSDIDSQLSMGYLYTKMVLCGRSRRVAIERHGARTACPMMSIGFILSSTLNLYCDTCIVIHLVCTVALSEARVARLA